MRLTIAAALALIPFALAGCGDDSGSASDEPSATESTASVESSPSATGKPVSASKTCAELYRPPDQLMPRAIELVHGSPSDESGDQAEEIAGGLATAEGHALGPLAEDIAVARAGIEAVAAGEEPDVAAFDKSINRLARNCELYMD